jgi:hypothetical protein
VERSGGNGAPFRVISPQIPGAGTTLDPHHYEFLDEDPGTGKKFYRLRQTDLDGTIHVNEPVGIETDSSRPIDPPDRIALFQNYPNPFNPVTEVLFYLPNGGPTKLEVFDVLGNRVVTLVDKVMPAGYHRSIFEASKLASGGYILRIEQGRWMGTRRMMLLK